MEFCCHKPVALRRRLASHHEVHGGEEVIPTTSDQAVGSESQAVSSLLGSSRSKLECLKKASQTVGNGSSPGGHAHNGEDVTDGLDVAELTSQGPVPGKSIRAHGKILVVEHLETRVLDGVKSLRDLAHVGDTITLLDTQSNLTVAEVIVVVLVGHEPLVHTEDTTGLENSEDLAVDTLKSRGVASSLNGIDGIEAVVREGHLLKGVLAGGRDPRMLDCTNHKVTLDKLELV